MTIQTWPELGPYRMLSLLGKGGMGEVYRARDTRLGREVAIKVLPDAVASDPDRIARFDREAKVLAALNHPHIAALYGMEESSGRHFLIMELIEGETLEERLRHGPLPPREVLAVACQIAEAMEAAHEKGVIHRDLKPANIKITPDDSVKVLDFGLARLNDPNVPNDPNAVTNSPTLSVMGTQAGVILGTAAYMSPEQAKGAVADHRSDVFSFGTVLYEMLTGRQAFNGDTPAEILASVLIRDADLSVLPSGLNPRVVDLLRRCLDKNPKRRWQAAGDLRAELESLVAGAGTIAGFTKQESGYVHRRQVRLAWSAAVVASLAAVGLAVPAVVRLREAPPEPTAIRSTILAPEGTTLEFTNGAGLPALSPDGRRIVFGARATDGTHPLWVRSLDGLSAQPLAGTEGATFPFWSPDSRSIAFFADGKLKKIDAAGGPVLTLADAPNGRGGSWSRSGVIIFAPSNDPGLQRVSSAGGASNPVSSERGSLPWFLPDGVHFLYQEQIVETAPRGVVMPIRVGSLEGNGSTALGVGSNATYAAGHLIFIREGSTLMAQPFDVERLVTTGEAIPIAERVQTVLGSGRVGVFSTSENGLLLYRQGAGVRRQLTWFDRTGKAAGTVGEPDENLTGDAELSPDGRRIAVARAVQGNSDVWLIDLVRGGSTRFTFDAFIDRRPTWSLDGNQIVFGSNRQGRTIADFDLYTKSANGTDVEQLLLDSPNPKTSYGWSSDGRILLYGEQNPKSSGDVWALPLQGDRKPVAIANSSFNEQNGSFAPDGRWIAYNANESGRMEIYVVPFPTGSGKWQVSTAGGIWPRWRRDGKELFFMGLDGQMMAVTIKGSGGSFEASSPESLFDSRLTIPAAVGRPQYAVAPDGRFLMTISVDDDATSASMTLVQNWARSRTP